MSILSNPTACKSVRTGHCNAFDAFLNHVETMHSQGKASFEAEFYVSLCQDVHMYILHSVGLAQFGKMCGLLYIVLTVNLQ